MVFAQGWLQLDIGLMAGSCLFCVVCGQPPPSLLEKASGPPLEGRARTLATWLANDALWGVWSPPAPSLLEKASGPPLEGRARSLALELNASDSGPAYSSTHNRLMMAFHVLEQPLDTYIRLSARSGLDRVLSVSVPVSQVFLHLCLTRAEGHYMP